jgi:hypothetical protein
VALVLLVISIATPGKPEVIHFKNGDRLTGTFEPILGGNITFTTEVLGSISIPIPKIETFTTEASVVVMLKGRQTAHGHFALIKTGVWMVEASGVSTPLEKKEIVAVYPVEVYRPASPERRHRPWQDWKGNGNFGLNVQCSSARSGSLNIGLDALRVEPTLPGLPPRLRSHYSLDMSFMHVTTPSGVNSTANTLTSGLRQDSFFSRDQHNFFFVQAQFDQIEPQNLQLRQTYGGGVGRDVIQYPWVTFSIRGGADFVKERFLPSALQQNGGILVRNNSEGLIGEKFALNVFKRLSFEHELDVYPSLSSAGDYRFDTSNVISSPISPRLSFRVGFTDHFLSAPLPGTEQNDLIFTTGIGFKF